MQISAINCLVADSSKFGTVRMHNFGSIDDFDIVITDKGISQKWIDTLESKGIKLIIA